MQCIDISTGLDSYLVFPYFGFLRCEELPSMSSEDAKTLESSRCLHIPARPALDDFVREYFLHVHPNLPMLDEGQFWSMYRSREATSREPSTLALFLFQAMLFASSSASQPSFPRPPPPPGPAARTLQVKLD
jgi:hypothetical protein